MVKIKLAEAFIEVWAKKDRYNRDIRTLKRTNEKNVKKMQEKWDGYAKNIRKVGIAVTAVGVAITAALAKIMSHAVKTGDMFDKMSKRTGESVESLSALKHAADISGTSIQTVETGLKLLSRAMDDMSRGVGEAKDKFEKLGISVVDSNGNLRSTVDVMLDVADAMSGVASETEKTAIATDLFGRSGAQLIPLLKEGKEGINDLMSEAKRLGLVISTEAAAAAAEFNDRLTELKSSLGAASLQIGNALLPVLQPLVESFTEIAVSLSEWIREHPKLTSQLVKFGGIMGILMATGGPLMILAPTIISTVTAIKLAIPALAGLGTTAAVALPPLVAIASTLWAIKRVIDAIQDPTTVLKGRIEQLTDRSGALSRTISTLRNKLQELEDAGFEPIRATMGIFGDELDNINKALGSNLSRTANVQDVLNALENQLSHTEKEGEQLASTLGGLADAERAAKEMTDAITDAMRADADGTASYETALNDLVGSLETLRGVGPLDFLDLSNLKPDPVIAGLDSMIGRVGDLKDKLTELPEFKRELEPREMTVGFKRVGLRGPITPEEIFGPTPIEEVASQYLGNIDQVLSKLVPDVPGKLVQIGIDTEELDKGIRLAKQRTNELKRIMDEFQEGFLPEKENLDRLWKEEEARLRSLGMASEDIDKARFNHYRDFNKKREDVADDFLRRMIDNQNTVADKDEQNQERIAQNTIEANEEKKSNTKKLNDWYAKELKRLQREEEKSLKEKERMLTQARREEVQAYEEERRLQDQLLSSLTAAQKAYYDDITGMAQNYERMMSSELEKVHKAWDDGSKSMARGFREAMFEITKEQRNWRDEWKDIIWDVEANFSDLYASMVDWDQMPEWERFWGRVKDIVIGAFADILAAETVKLVLGGLDIGIETGAAGGGVKETAVRTATGTAISAGLKEIGGRIKQRITGEEEPITVEPALPPADGVPAGLPSTGAEITTGGIPLPSVETREEIPTDREAEIAATGAAISGGLGGLAVAGGIAGAWVTGFVLLQRKREREREEAERALEREAAQRGVPVGELRTHRQQEARFADLARSHGLTVEETRAILKMEDEKGRRLDLPSLTRFAEPPGERPFGPMGKEGIAFGEIRGRALGGPLPGEYTQPIGPWGRAKTREPGPLQPEREEGPETRTLAELAEQVFIANTLQRRQQRLMQEREEEEVEPEEEIPELARGGVFRKPTLARIAERGAEAVIPLADGNVPVQFMGLPKMPEIDFQPRINMPAADGQSMSQPAPRQSSVTLDIGNININFPNVTDFRDLSYSETKAWIDNRLMPAILEAAREGRTNIVLVS